MTRLPQFPDNHPLTEEQRQFAAGASAARQVAQREIQKTVYDANLRKWCVEQAIKATDDRGSAPAFLVDQPNLTEVRFAVVALAQQIFEFVSESVQVTE